MAWKLHRGGRFRAWLGAKLGGGPELGDRAWRRSVHIVAGCAVLIYFVLPPRFFLVLPNEAVLLLALAGVLILEAMRHTVGVELPSIRPWEEGRVASYAYFAVALVVAVLVFPRPIAITVILGTALVDPLVGELRLRAVPPTTLWYVPILVYGLIGTFALAGVGRWNILAAFLASFAVGALAVAVERPKRSWYDDDLAMTLVPGVVLTVTLWLFPGIAHLG